MPMMGKAACVAAATPGILEMYIDRARGIVTPTSFPSNMTASRESVMDLDIDLPASSE